MPDQSVTKVDTRVFDFDKAVEEAKRDYPKETKGVTFINTSAPDAYEQIVAFAEKNKLNNIQFNRMLGHLDNKTAIATEMNGEKFMLIPAAREAERGQFKDSQYKSAYFCFQHELGHFVVPGAHTEDKKKETIWREHAADFFAVTRGIQAGVFDKQDIVNQATSRQIESLTAYTDITHMSTMTLDAVAINPKNIDFLSLTKEQILKVAQEHATQFEFDSKTESSFTDVMKLGKVRGQRGFETLDQVEVAVNLRAQALCELCQSAPANSQAFYLSARLLEKIIENGGVDYGGHKIEIDTTGDKFRKAQEAIAVKAGDRDIGAKKALQTSSFMKEGPKEEKTMVSLVRNIVKPKTLKI